MDKVTLIRTATGEYFLGIKKEQKDDSIVILTQVRNLVPQMTANGVGVAAAAVVPFAVKSPDTITLPKNLIMVEVEEDNINPNIVSGYKSEITGIDLSASKPSIVTP